MVERAGRRALKWAQSAVDAGPALRRRRRESVRNKVRPGFGDLEVQTDEPVVAAALVSPPGPDVQSDRRTRPA